MDLIAICRIVFVVLSGILLSLTFCLRRYRINRHAARLFFYVSLILIIVGVKG